MDDGATEQSANPTVPTTPAPKRRWFRFSLRTLLVFVLLVGSGMGLWRVCDAWTLGWRFEVPRTNTYTPWLEAGARLSHDKTRLCWRASDCVWRMYDTNTGELCWTWKRPSDEFLMVGNNDPEITFVGDDQFVAISRMVSSRLLLRVADGSPVAANAPEACVADILPEPKPGRGIYTSFSPDGRRQIGRAEAQGTAGWSLSQPATKQQIAFLPGANEPRGSCFSPDGQRFAIAAYGGVVCIHDSNDGCLLATLQPGPMCRGVEFSDDGATLLVVGRNWNVWLYHRRRPEYWWGLAWLPEFWLTAVFAVAFVWSVWRDRRELPMPTGGAAA